MTDAVIFLDFDGVLHRFEGTHFEYVERLADVLDAHPGAKIVFSTSWQYQMSTAELAAHLPERMRSRVIGGTADDAAQAHLDSREPGWLSNFSRTPGIVSFHNRERLAEGWIQAYRPGVPLLSLDDDAFRFSYRCNRLLLCLDGFYESEAALLHSWLAAPGRDMQEIVREAAPADPADWTVRDATAAVIYRDGEPVLDALPDVLREAALRLMGTPTAEQWEAMLSSWGMTRRWPPAMDEDDMKKEWLP